MRTKIVMESSRKKVTPRRATTSPAYDPENDVFAGCPEYFPVNESAINWVSIGNKNNVGDEQSTPKRPSVRKSVTKNSARKSSSKSHNSSFNDTTQSPYPTNSRNQVNTPRKLICTPSGQNKVQQNSLSCSKVIHTPKSYRDMYSAMLSKSASKISTEEVYRAAVEGKRLLNEILCKTEGNKKLTSPGALCKQQFDGVRRLIRTPIRSPSGTPKPSTSSAASEGSHEDSFQMNNSMELKMSDTSNVYSDDDDIDLPPTQPISSLILRDVTAFVEVRSSVDTQGLGIKEQLINLGAKVANSFNKKVTHVVFMNGQMSTYKKAVERNIPLVSVLWIEECKEAKIKVSERLYPPTDINEYESPDPLKKNKRRRFLHPLNSVRKYNAKKSKKKIELDKGETGKANPGLLEIEAQQKNIDSKSPLLGRGKSRTKITITGVVPLDTSNQRENEVDVQELNSMDDKLVTPLKNKHSEDNTVQLITLDSRDDCLPVTPLAVKSFSLRSLISSRCDDEKNINNLNDSRNKSNDTVTSNVLVSSNNTSVFESRYGINTSAEKLHISEKTNLTCTALSVRTLVLDTSLQTSDRSLQKNSNNTVVSKVVENHKCDELLAIKTEQNADDNNSQDGISRDNEKTVDQFNCSEIRRTCKRKLMPLSQNLCVSPEIVRKRRKMSLRSSSNVVISHQKSVNVSESDGNKTADSATCNTTCVQSKSERSSVDSITAHRHRSQQRARESVLQLPSIVCTTMTSEDIGVITSIVRKLGSYVLECEVTAKTSHVVAKEAKRTLKVLKGLARGCWIVRQDWVLKSLEKGQWLGEEEFELIEFSSVVKQYHIEKLSFGPAYKPDLFSSCGKFFVSSNNSPPKADVEELITLCGGQVVSSVRSAEIAVGETTHYKDVKCVGVNWVLDSLSNKILLPLNKYSMDNREEGDQFKVNTC